MLQVEHLVKSFGKSEVIKAVNDVSFTVNSGEIIGLLGPNGAGKTTIIRMLLSVLRPDMGRILYFGLDLEKNRSEILEQVGFASTYTTLPLFLTVRENLEIHARLYGIKSTERRERIEQFLKRFDAQDLSDRKFTQLSAGQRTKVMVMKAFLTRPKIALLDEPTASLDPDVAQVIREFVSEQRKVYGTAIIYTSHNMQEITELCDQVIFLRAGEIIARDTPENLAEKCSVSRIECNILEGRERLSPLLARSEIKAEWNERRLILHLASERIPFVMSEIVKQKVTFSDLVVTRPSLEDFFLMQVR